MKALAKSLTAILFVLLALSASAQTTPPDNNTTKPSCKGKFPNPVTDYCWSCVFPIAIAGGARVTDGQDDNDSSSKTTPMCICKNSSDVYVLGLRSAFWEPARMIDVTRTPYCFVGMGGEYIDFGIPAPRHNGSSPHTGEDGEAMFYQAHWYTNPLLFWLEVLLDDTCLEMQTFDLVYLTELDPLWADSELNFILNPDVILWANPVATVACAADCVAATIGMPIDKMMWCSGCQGSMFPLNGWVSSGAGGVGISSLILTRLTAKMHRQSLAVAGAGDNGLCGYYLEPVMTKSNYKYTMLYPVPQTEKIFGKCCQPFGRTTVLWGAGREYPVDGEDFVYQLFRKRDCCDWSLLMDAASSVGP